MWVTGELDGAEMRQAAEDLDARIHHSDPQMIDDACIYAKVEVDDTPLAHDVAPTQDYNIALIPAEPAPEVTPTPWRIQREGNDPGDPSWCET